MFVQFGRIVKMFHILMLHGLCYTFAKIKVERSNLLLTLNEICVIPYWKREFQPIIGAIIKYQRILKENVSMN